MNTYTYLTLFLIFNTELADARKISHHNTYRRFYDT